MENIVKTFEEFQLNEAKVLFKEKDLKDLEFDIEGATRNDAPDFADAYLSNGKLNGKWLTDEQMEYIEEAYPEWFEEEVQNSLR